MSRIIRNTIITSIACMTLFVTGCDSKKGGTPLKDNPLAEVSTLPFEAPDFSKIENAHYLPAIKEGINQQRAEIQAIINNTEAPTFQNVILEYEKSGKLLHRAVSTFFALASAEGTDEIRAIEEEAIPLLSAWGDELAFNQEFFNKVKAVYDNEYNTLQGEDQKLLKEIYEGFVKNGATLDADKKAELEKINARIAVLEQQFGNIMTECRNDATVWVENEAELAGISEADKVQLKADAEQLGGQAPYAILIMNYTQQNIMASLDNRALREKIFNASIHRADGTNKHNTFAIVAEMSKFRARKAEILGFENFAAYNLHDTMAKNTTNVQNFLSSLISAYVPAATKEMKEIQEFARRTEGSDFVLRPYDVTYYAAKMKQEKFNFSTDEVMPYFQVDSVLINGVFYAANRAYGLTFEERKDIPVYHKDVKVYTVFDKDGSELALFYFDPFRRPTKRGGAWMDQFIKQSRFNGTKPVVFNVCNFTKAPEGQPSLLTWNDVTTLFHEFGHGLHGMFSNVEYATLSGTNVPNDFVEMPSQFNEYFASVPEVFSHYARHYETGEAMPEELKSKMLESINYLPAYSLGENLQSTSIDQLWHMRSSADAVSEADAPSFDTKSLEALGLNMSQIVPRYASSYFNHVWGGGYAAGYYSYLWSEVLSSNVSEFFTKNGALNPEVGQKYRDLILSVGNTVDLGKAFSDFTGLAEPDADALLRARGLK